MPNFAFALVPVGILLGVALCLSTHADAQAAGCAPAQEVAEALDKAEKLASEQIGPDEAAELISMLKAKAVAINDEICFRTEDFAEFGHILAQFFEHHLSATTRQRRDDWQPSFAEDDREDSVVSSGCRCLTCPDTFESWCSPKSSTPSCCPRYCANIFSTISVGALSWLKGSGVDACCKEGVIKCSSRPGNRQKPAKSTPKRNKGSSSSAQESTSSSGDVPDFDFDGSGEPQKTPAPKPLSEDKTPPPTPRSDDKTSNAKSRANDKKPKRRTDKKDGDVVFSVTESAGLGELSTSGLLQATTSVSGDPAVEMPSPSPTQSAVIGFSMAPTPSFSTAATLTESPWPSVQPNAASALDGAQSTEAKPTPNTQLASVGAITTATPSVSIQVADTVPTIAPSPVDTELQAPPSPMLQTAYPSASATPRPFDNGGLQTGLSVEEAPPSPSLTGPAYTSPFSPASSPSLSPSPSPYPRGPFTLESEAEPPPTPVFGASAIPFVSPEWAVEASTDARPPITGPSGVTGMGAQISLPSPTVTPSPPQTLSGDFDTLWDSPAPAWAPAATAQPTFSDNTDGDMEPFV